MANPLTREVAGRPVYVWAGVVVAGVGLGLLVTRRKAKVPDADELAADVGTSMPGGLPAIGPNRLTAVPPDPVAPSITTNAEWSRKAVAMLLQSGIVADAFAAEQALAKYLSGRDVTGAERGIVNQAIQLAGPPPEGSPVVSIIDPPPPTSITPATPAAPAFAEVRFTLQDFGGSIERAAEHFYGDPSAWRKIRVYDPQGAPGTGWINDQSYRELQPHTPLVVGTVDRVR